MTTNPNPPTHANIPFFDHADQQEGFFSLRTCDGMIAIGTSLRDNGDVEPLITIEVARALAKRILEITESSETTSHP